MANDLVPTGRRGDDDGHEYAFEPDTRDEGEQWNSPEFSGRPPRHHLPPGAENFGTQRTRKRGYQAHIADEDAARGRRAGDNTFAVIRETDAAEHRQKRLDWGDTRTWLIISALFFGFLLVVAAIYFMPQGQHAAPPSARLY